MSMTFATDVIISSTTNPVKSLSTTKLLVPEGADSTTISLGSAGQILKTDGANKVYWANDAGVVIQNQLNVNSGEYPLLLKHSASNTTETDTVNFSNVKYSASDQGLILYGNSTIVNSDVDLTNANNRTDSTLTGNAITSIQRICFCPNNTSGPANAYASLASGVAYDSSRGNYTYIGFRIRDKDDTEQHNWANIGYFSIRQYKNKQVRAQIQNNNSDAVTAFYVISSKSAYVGSNNSTTSINLALCNSESAPSQHGLWSSGYYDTEYHASQRWLIYRNSENETWIGSALHTGSPYYVHSDNNSGLIHYKPNLGNVNIFTQISDDGLIGMRSNGYWNGTAKAGSSAWFFYRDNTGANIFNGTATGCLALTGGEMTGQIRMNAANIHFKAGSLTKGTNPSENTNSPGIFIHDKSGTLDSAHRLATFYGYIVLNQDSTSGNTSGQARMLAYEWVANSSVHAYFAVACNKNPAKKRTYTNCLIYGAVWNDYAEYRKGDVTDGGYCVTETSSGIMTKSTERLQPGCRLTSDTFGFAIGETKDCKTPIAVSGRVLVYPYRKKEEYPLGAAVCSAPNGTIDVMTREEIMMYPERILGTVSEIPTYDIWYAGHDGTDDPNEEPPKEIPVNGRIWIYVK